MKEVNKHQHAKGDTYTVCISINSSVDDGRRRKEGVRNISVIVLFDGPCAKYLPF